MKNNQDSTENNAGTLFLKSAVDDELGSNNDQFEVKHKKKRKGRANNVAKYFQKYCEYSTIHGMKYVGEQRGIFERFLWVAVLTTLCTCSTMLIYKAYQKWSQTPVIVTFATTETPILEIPFPAITICPEVKSRPSVFNFSDVVIKKLRNLTTTSVEDAYFDSFFSICGDLEIYKPLGGPDTIQDLSVAKLLDLLPKSASIVEWLSQEQETDVLAKIYTNAGVCQTFNMLDIQDVLVNPPYYMGRGSVENTTANGWSIDDGYDENLNEGHYPRRTVVPGIYGGFEVLLVTNKNHLDYVCRESFQGYMVTLHSPAEIPDMDQHFRVPLEHAVHARVTPRVITVSQELRSYTPENRKCYFSNEKALYHFKNYTQTNCMLECLTNYTFASCGCVYNYMPRNQSMPVCGAGKIPCLELVRANYFKYYARVLDQNATFRSPCQCLPSCTSINYDSETSQSMIQINKMFEILRTTNQSAPFDTNKYHVSGLQVYFKELQFMTTKRQELYGYVDFLANCGGLLGLFMGFSVTSLIEIVYFLSFRLICNVTHYGKGYWFGRKDA